MKTWWLAIDKNDKNSSYLELKHKKIVAQGWSALGNLDLLRKCVPNNKKEFFSIIQLLGDVAYKSKGWWLHKDKKATRCPTVMWNLMNVKKGDLIVGIEGTQVMGICEMPVDGVESYRYDSGYEYAHTIGFPVKWIDWNKNNFGDFIPNAPEQSVQGIRGLNKESFDVKEAWKKYKSSQNG